MAVFFFGSGCANGINLIITWFPTNTHPPDNAALARTVPAFKNNDGAFFMDNLTKMHMRQTFLHIGQQLIIIAIKNETILIFFILYFHVPPLSPAFSICNIIGYLSIFCKPDG